MSNTMASYYKKFRTSRSDDDMARQRADIQDTELYDILSRAVVSLNWLRYGDSMAAKRQPKMLAPHRKFFKSS